MLGPFAIDAYLPAFQDIELSLQASSIEVQQTLTAYLFSVGIMALWHGGLSDSYGRRSVILWSLVAFALSSLGCAASYKVGYLWVFRIVQGLSAGAGMIVGRAIIRDRYSGIAVTRMMTLVTMLVSVAPALAPIMGGVIAKWLGWRSVFLFMFLFTAVLFWYCYRYLPETHGPAERHPFLPRQVIQRYRQIFLTPLFHWKAAAVAFSFAGFFLYVAAAPVLLMQRLGLRLDQFGWQFIPSVTGIFIGSLIVNKLAAKLVTPVQVMLGFAVAMSAGLINVGYHLFHAPTVASAIIPLFLYTIGLAILSPGSTLMVLDLFPAMRGTVASCQAFTSKMLITLVAGIAAPILSQSVLWLATGQLVFCLIALISWRVARTDRMKQSRRHLHTWETNEENLS